MTVPCQHLVVRVHDGELQGQRLKKRGKDGVRQLSLEHERPPLSKAGKCSTRAAPYQEYASARIRQRGRYGVLWGGRMGAAPHQRAVFFSRAPSDTGE